MGSDNRALSRQERPAEMQRFQVFFDATPDLLFVLRMPSGQICDVNRTACDHLGQTRELLIGSMSSRWIRGSGTRFEDVLQQLSDDCEGAATLAGELICSDDSRVPAELVVRRTQIQGEQIAIVAARDITDRYLARQALLESEAKYRALVETSSDWIWEVDAQGIYTYASPKVTEFLGYQPEEVVGKTPFDFMRSDEAKRLLDMLAPYLTDPRPFSAWENVNLHKDGHEVVLETSGVPIFDADGVLLGYRGVDRDVTERRQARDALREREARLESIFRAAPTGIGVVADRVLLQINERISEMTGYTTQELVGRSTRILYPSDEDFEYAGREGSRQIRESGVISLEARWRRKDGSFLDVLLNSAPIDPDDPSIGLTFTALDITDRKQAEAEREKLLAELEAKNAELERFTYTVSHDLKSPLITIKGYLGILAEDLHAGNTQNVEEDIQRISGSADTMTTLLRELLELSRVGRIVNPPSAIRIDEVAREAVRAVEGLISERGVRIEIEPSLPLVYGDRQRLLEVLQNLIENGVKYMGEQETPLIQIGAKLIEGVIQVHVQDNGIGIEPEYQERIFGLFDQLNPKNDGTGIGLALVKRIVDVHGGQIWVESDGAGTGSKFCFTVPAPP